jgi:hypothetical protein
MGLDKLPQSLPMLLDATTFPLIPLEAQIFEVACGMFGKRFKRICGDFLPGVGRDKSRD